MPQDYRLKQITAALDPIPDWQPKGMRKLAKRVRWEQGWQGAGPLSYRSLKRTVGGDSLRQTLHAIDNNDPPRSLRQAYQRLGFPVGGSVTRLPNGPISLRKIAKRIKAPDTVPLRFLSYNTYLLPGFQIPLGHWIDDTVGWNALSWFGIPFGGALLVSLGLASIPGVALATILEAAGFTPSKVIEAVFPGGIDLNSIASFAAKPALEERTRLLGPALGLYDVCCLCEVYTQTTRQEILVRLEQTSVGAPFVSTAGPDESGTWTLLGSGLFFLAKSNRPIVKTERIIFTNRGSRVKDSDAWANKGVLLNIIDLGFGQLELFQTHFYYGGGIKDHVPLPGVSNPSEEERMNVWRAEIAELANFYREHHQPQNVALITGDFNMSGANVREYAEMRRVMDSLNMRDLWAWDVYDHNPSEGHTCRFTDGDESQWQKEFSDVCAPLEQAGLLRPWRQYCNDSVLHDKPPPSGVGRYDYIFVESPAVSHRYHLEASRILQRPFPLGNEIEKEQYLSDHLALELTLYCSPRD